MIHDPIQGRARTVADFLDDAAKVDPFQRAMAQHSAMHDALCADLFGIGAGRQSSFTRLNAMRDRLIQGEH